MFQKNIIPSWLKKTIGYLSVTLPALLFTRLSLAAGENGDILAGIIPSLKSNFGAHSTVMMGAYLVELFVAVGMWVKSRNFFVFSGIIVVSLFINGVLKFVLGW